MLRTQSKYVFKLLKNKELLVPGRAIELGLKPLWMPAVGEFCPSRYPQSYPAARVTA